MNVEDQRDPCANGSCRSSQSYLVIFLILRRKTYSKSKSRTNQHWGMTIATVFFLSMGSELNIRYTFSQGSTGKSRFFIDVQRYTQSRSVILFQLIKFLTIQKSQFQYFLPHSFYHSLPFSSIALFARGRSSLLSLPVTPTESSTVSITLIMVRLQQKFISQNLGGGAD